MSKDNLPAHARDGRTMARMSRRDGASKPFAWTTIFYLLLVFIAPLTLLGTAHAEENETNVQENYGTGMFIAFLRSQWSLQDC